MTDGDLRDRISRLEAYIDELAETVEGCRKIILASKIAIAAGGISMAAILFGAIRFDPLVMVAAMAAILGGVVVFGSNVSTSQQTVARIKEAETARAELIDKLELRAVDDGAMQKHAPDALQQAVRSAVQKQR
jgi:hypothetical protein